MAWTSLGVLFFLRSLYSKFSSFLIVSPTRGVTQPRLTRGSPGRSLGSFGGGGGGSRGFLCSQAAAERTQRSSSMGGAMIGGWVL